MLYHSAFMCKNFYHIGFSDRNSYFEAGQCIGNGIFYQD